MHCLAIWVALASQAMYQVPERPTNTADPHLAKIEDAPDPMLRLKKTKEPAPGVRKGREEADREFDADRAKIWEYGWNTSLISEPIDRETGLYHSSFGCAIDLETYGRINGHNARLAEIIRARGLPKNSFKPWEKELFDLAGYFEARSRTERPIRLTVGGPEARSPDGRYALKVASRVSKAVPEIELESREQAFIVVSGRDTEDDWIGLFPKESELVWGPEGSWFAVLRGQSRLGQRGEHMALDLRECRTIRREFEDRPRSAPLKK